MIFEVAGEKPCLDADWEAKTVSALNAQLGVNGVHSALLHFGKLPVDRRHNAKLEREALAVWAQKRVPRGTA